MDHAIRLVHHLAASGGTIMTQCLAAMPSVAVLSEIHPHILIDEYSPVRQAYAGCGILSLADMEFVFKRDIALINGRCAQAGKRLLIRDWSFGDYLRDAPDLALDLTLRNVLSADFPVLSHVTMRHPIDAWIGMNLQDWVSHLTIADYLNRYRLFADRAIQLGFSRYEDFCRDPDGVLQRICDHLQLTFDPAYRSDLAQVNHMTGGSGRFSLEITPRARQPIAPAILAQFRDNAVYGEVCAMLGYEA